MKIAIDLSSLDYNFSGIERYALNISIQLLKLDTTDTFYLIFSNKVHPAFHDLTADSSNIKIKIVQAGKKKLSRLILQQIKLFSALTHIKPECAIFPAAEPPLLYTKRMIATQHDIGFFDCPSMWKWYVTLYNKILLRATLKKKKCILAAVSNFTRERLGKRFGVDTSAVAVAYNGVNNSFCDYSLTPDKESQLIKKYNIPRHYLLCLATLEPRKNLGLLIKAYDELCTAEKIDIDLVLAGRKGWKIDNLLDNVSTKTKNRIFVTGFIDNEDLAGIYKLSSLFIFPSLYEGFGLPPLEALMSTVNILVSDIEVFKEVYGEHAAYFKSNDCDDLKLKIQSCLRQNTPPDSLSIEQLKEKYSWVSSAKVYLNILNCIKQN